MPQSGSDCNITTGGRIRNNQPAPIDPHAVYTLNEAAQLLRVRPRKVRDLEAAGRLRRCAHTRLVMFLGEELLKLARGEKSWP